MTPLTCLQCTRTIPEADVPFALKRGKDGLICTWCRGTRVKIAGVRLERCIAESRSESTFEALRESGEACRVTVARSFGPIRVADLERDARSAAARRHPVVLRLLGFGIEGDYVWWAEESCSGRTLAKLFGPPLDPRWSARVIAELASGLVLLDTHIANSIEPDAVVVQESGAPRVSGFSGAAYVEREGRGWARLGEGPMGMLAFMPPEQIDDATNVDERTTVYRLGAFLYQMLAGRRPFTGKTNMDFFMKILNELPQPIERPAVPGALVAVVGRCLAKQPGERFASLDALARALRGT